MLSRKHFGLTRTEVDALSDADFIQTVGGALWLEDRMIESLATAVQRGIVQAFKGS